MGVMNCTLVKAALMAASFSLPVYAADLGASGLEGSYKDFGGTAVTWSGFYLGINGGYASGDWKGDFTYQGAADAAFNPGKKISADGGFGGGQIGFNKQMNSILVGVEADIEGADLKGKSSFNNDNILFYNGHSPSFTKNVDSRLDYFGTLRGRFGYSFGSVLPYFTGGLAWGHTHSDLTVYNNYLNYLGILSGPSGNGSVTEDHLGWTIGAGVEYAVDTKWSVKAEYLYVDLGTENYRYAGMIAAGIGGGAFNTDGLRSDLNFNSVKVGLNYRIDGHDPLK